MAVTGHESSDDLKLQLSKRLYTAVVLNASVLKVKDVLKIPEIERIVTILRKRSIWNGVRDFLQNYPCFFLVADENGCPAIKPIVTVEFCRDFDGKRGCTKTFCAKLHVCRHFVKGKCTFGPRCKKPHHFQDSNTREVLQKHFLDELNDEQAREFLCRNVQHLLDPDIANAEVPKSLEICKYYNVATGCTRDFCPYIHVCRFFAEDGNCKFGAQCIRKHDINNVHSRILLHRYHMDHLNEQQVLAYLKIKGENRDQQQQQQPANVKEMNGKPSLVSTNNTMNLNMSPQPQQQQQQFPQYPTPTTTLFGNLKSLINDRNSSRKLSQPTSAGVMNGLPSIMDPLAQQRKLSLPTPPMPRSNVYRPGSNKEEISSTNHVNSTTAHMMLGGGSQSNGSPLINTRNSSSFKASSWSADIDNLSTHSTSSTPLLSHPFNTNSSSSKTSSYLTEESFHNYHNRFPSDTNLLNGHHNGNTLSSNFPKSTSGHHLSKSYNDSSLARDFQQQSFSLHELHDSKTGGRFSSHSQDHLGLHNLSLTSQQQNNNNNNITIPNNKSNNHLYQHLTDSFDNIASIDDFDDQLSTTSSLPFSNSLCSQSNSLFTSRNPIIRTSSNDIISPTGSSSSINGGSNNNNNNNNNSNANPNGRSPAFEINDPFSDWHENGDRMFRTFASKDSDDDFNMPYYRTRSLPNFRSTSLYKTPVKSPVKPTENKPSASERKTNSEQHEEVECVCQNLEICMPNLAKMCKVVKCKKQHVEEPFVWQIAATHSKKPYSNYKNENNNPKKLVWINIDETENMKLELAYCSVEIEQSEIEMLGDNIMVNFDNMTGEGRWDISSINHSSSSRSCDLSAWLLQATDTDVPSRRNSQESTLYQVRRLSTASSLCEDFDLKYSTHWCWYWQDSFGMWRRFPRKQSDVIESTTCMSDDIETKFLTGHEQCLFEEQKLLFDFKSMVQINGHTYKQRRIRRRPQFISKEQRCQMPSPSSSFTDIDYSRPMYWTGDTKNSMYQLVDVEDTSEILSTVRRHFSQSMIGKTYEILSLKLVQNIRLWTKYSRLRSQLKSSIEMREKFVFKSMSEEELSGICQQGFQICTCKHNAECSEENTFATEAKSCLSDSEKESGELRYMFCVRMAVPLSDLKDKSSSILTGKVVEEDEESSSDDENQWVPPPPLTNENSNIICRHSNQDLWQNKIDFFNFYSREAETEIVQPHNERIHKWIN